MYITNLFQIRQLCDVLYIKVTVIVFNFSNQKRLHKISTKTSNVLSSTAYALRKRTSERKKDDGH